MTKGEAIVREWIAAKAYDVGTTYNKLTAIIDAALAEARAAGEGLREGIEAMACAHRECKTIVNLLAEYDEAIRVRGGNRA